LIRGNFRVDPMLQHFPQGTRRRNNRFFSGLLATWTLLIFSSAGWNVYAVNRDTIEKALVEARTILEHNLAYRRWNAKHGGVYAVLSKDNQPNPFIQLTFRDLASCEGVALTLINPYQMTRQAYEMLRQYSPSLAVANRTVSLNPVNSENSPDDWERTALLAFEKGVPEVSEVTQIEGRPYLRLLAPYLTEEKCLHCHGYQGYQVGDIRGGASIAVPMEPYEEIAAGSRASILFSHLLLWFLGTGGILLFGRSFQRYESAIAASEEKYRIVSEFAHHFEWWIDEQERIAFVSPSCKRVTGYDREEYLARPQLLLEIIHPDDQKRFEAYISKAKNEDQDEQVFRIITKDGRVRWLSHSCSAIRLEGKYLGRRGSNRDITEKMELEERLIQAKKMECLGHFSAGIAHDFNNVLSSITTFTHLIEDELEEKRPQLESLFYHILIAAKLGRNMTSNLLAFGRRQGTRLEPLSLNKVVREGLPIIKALLHEDIYCRLALSEADLPVRVDGAQIEQLLINICTNARDAMPQGGELRIETGPLALAEPRAGQFGTIPAGRYMMLLISDSGHGIPPDDMPQIFEPFFSTKNCKGTGLGLAIVSNIIKENGAHLEVDSAIGRGTTFRVFFAVLDPTAAG
jgi:PAS domain S-box-containing protein